jgi:hypothetical protein
MVIPFRLFVANKPLPYRPEAMNLEWHTESIRVSR